MADPLDRIQDQLAAIAASQVRMETVVNGILAEAKRTNGRVTVNEEWRRLHDLREASRDGEAKARAEAFLSKKQVTALLSALAAITGIMATVGTIVARMLT